MARVSPPHTHQVYSPDGKNRSPERIVKPATHVPVDLAGTPVQVYRRPDKPTHAMFPKCQEDWKEIAELFEARWNFPHCLGGIDGKQVDIIPPAGGGSEFFNYKGRNSMVLLGIFNAKYLFILADFGTNGRVSDGGVLQNTKFFEMLTKSELHIPTEEHVKGTNRNLPYVFIADDAFALWNDMMKPFRQADLTSQEKKI
ncbi:unnamed protein product [Acanthoscelides obtectus]|uniref:DDE Tnp4 domain-containing protein n=1 Tax=Acanthoscelides obtectus TaxID=200917 RepID=A0A9P0MEK6_ACAOB|nr:unnamed protein product [Acanthoscelides obtectus]CAK1682785.1 hypothetical protein AOBTE_LOCUS33880 [Acanthoscelides obtectus]